MVTLYSKNNCHGCNATKQKLKELNVAYVEKNVDEDDKARDRVIALGFMQMPVVITDNDSWFGYDPVRLENLTKA